MRFLYEPCEIKKMDNRKVITFCFLKGILFALLFRLAHIFQF